MDTNANETARLATLSRMELFLLHIMEIVRPFAAETLRRVAIRVNVGATMESHARCAKSPAKSDVVILCAARSAPSLVPLALKIVHGFVRIVDDAKWLVRCHAIYYRARDGVRRL